ncbi:MAG: PqqD family protein [Pseudorhodoplanes sp.]
MSVTIDSILVRDKALATADLDGQIVVLNVRAGAYVGFNEVASEIWQLISEPCRVGEIFDTLSQSHDVDLATLSRDVMPFLQNLIDRRLAKQVDAGGAP